MVPGICGVVWYGDQRYILVLIRWFGLVLVLSRYHSRGGGFGGDGEYCGLNVLSNGRENSIVTNYN